MNKIDQYWKLFKKEYPEFSAMDSPPPYFFCDNQKDADECAELVVKRIKQASSPSVWWFTKNQEEFPKVGDLAIITNWEGESKAIIRTTQITLVKLKDIRPEYAYIEGEGDRSLEYWKQVHLEYYSREMKEYGESPDEEMEIVCEYFETVFS
jgi:uncharacterized protein YhfF